jgi:hypothetical protein
MYVSGHGDHESGEVVGLKPGEINNHWKDDLRKVFIAGCSVLDINDYNDNYNNTPPDSPGEKWVDKGPKLWFGYNWYAPLDDNVGDPEFTAKIIKKYSSNRSSGINENWAWGKANQDMATTTDRYDFWGDHNPGQSPYNCCVIDRRQDPEEYWFFNYNANPAPAWEKRTRPTW